MNPFDQGSPVGQQQQPGYRGQQAPADYTQQQQQQQMQQPPPTFSVIQDPFAGQPQPAAPAPLDVSAYNTSSSSSSNNPPAPNVATSAAGGGAGGAGGINDLDQWLNDLKNGKQAPPPQALYYQHQHQQDDGSSPVMDGSGSGLASPAAGAQQQQQMPMPSDVPTLQAELGETRKERDYWRTKYEAANMGIGELTGRVAQLEADIAAMNGANQNLQQQVMAASASAAPAQTFPCANRRCNCTVAARDAFCAPSCQQGNACAQPVHQASAAAAAAPQQQQAPLPAQPQLVYPAPKMPQPGVTNSRRLDNNVVKICSHCRQSPRIPGVEFCDACSLTIEHGYKSMMPRFNNSIRFYGKNDPFYEFTNFFPVKIEYEGRVYRNSEALFQAAKFLYTAPQVAELIRRAKFPREAFDLAHQYYKYERKDWMQVRDDWMLLALRLKYKNAHMRRVLMATDPAVLIEHTTNDKYWGNNGDDTGKNRLGMLLMQVRHEISTGAL